jgi:hypothetical protein
LAERGQQVPTNTVTENSWILGTFQPAQIQHGNKREEARWGDHVWIRLAALGFGSRRIDLFDAGLFGMDRFRMGTWCAVRQYGPIHPKYRRSGTTGERVPDQPTVPFSHYDDTGVPLAATPPLRRMSPVFASF